MNETAQVASPSEVSRSNVQIESGMSKTLHNGIEVLGFLSGRPSGATVTEIADGIGVHRTVAHRLVRTLEAHRLCRRDDDKRISLATGLVTLAEAVEQDLRTLARPVLEGLADSTGATAHLVVREGIDEVRALMVLEPRGSRAHIAFRAGQLDPIDQGSAGLAMLATLRPSTGERSEVVEARRCGYAVTKGEVTASVIGISAGVPYRPERHLISLGVSVLEAADLERLGQLVVEAAQRLSRVLP